MRFLLIVSFVTVVGNLTPVDCRPEDLFSLDDAVGDDADLFPLEGLYASSTSELQPSDLAVKSDSALSEDDTDTSIFNANNLFTAENDSLGPSPLPLLQSSSACGTKQSNTLTNEDILQLQARGDASCPPPKSNDRIDSLVDLFQDPEGWLRRNLPPTQAPVGQVNQPGPDDDELNFEAFLNNRPIAFLFEEDTSKCPSEIFGLSTTPVCHRFEQHSAFREPGSWHTLYNVDPCQFCSLTLVLQTITIERDIDEAK
jgi:hypothetical protein